MVVDDTAPVNPADDLPLRGVKVLDASRILAGPLCTMVLGDLGARVIKVEGPAGDDTRRWGPPFVADQSAYYLSLNRNKRSVVLNLHIESDRQRFRQLVTEADVLVENFRPGTMEAWGLSYDRLAESNSGLVHCSITGFGPTGPYRDYPGFDPVVEAMSGLMSITGPAESAEPYKVGVAVVDVLAALHASTSILGLLHRRVASGRGGYLSVGLLDVAIASLVNVAGAYLVSGKTPERHGNDHPSIVPFGMFSTLDGDLMICVGSDRQWQLLGDVLGLEQEACAGLETNEQRVERRQDVRELLEARLATATAEHWAAHLMEAGVPASQVNDLPRVFATDHVKQSGLVQTIDLPHSGKTSFVGTPVLIDGRRPQIRSAPPLLGDAQAALADAAEATNGDGCRPSAWERAWDGDAMSGQGART